MKKDKSDLSVRIRQAGVLSSIPFMLAGGPLIGYFMGRWLDNWWGTDPYAKAVLMLLGFAGGARESFRLVKEAAKFK